MQQYAPVDLKSILTEKNCALIVVDVQNDFCHPDGMFAKSGAKMEMVQRVVEPINQLVEKAHQKGFPVFFIKQAGNQAIASAVWDHCRPSKAMAPDVFVCADGTWGNELYNLEPGPMDTVISKPRYDAFIGTPLDMILRSKKIETVVITGVTSNTCVETTVRHAFCNDLFVVVPEDACGSYDEEAHRMSMKNISIFFGDVTDTETVLHYWA